MLSLRQSLVLLLVVLWLAALAFAFSLDEKVATWVRDTVPVNKHLYRTHLLLELIKRPGWFPFTMGVAALLLIFHRLHGWAAASLLLSGVVVGAVYSVIKWIAGRHRPVIAIEPFGFHPFPQGFAGIWRESALCFPSGHASLSCASAMCLAMLLPRWGIGFFLIAFATCAERVLENAHYLSDVVAGAGLGVVVGWLITRTVLQIGNAPSEEIER